MKRKSLSFLPRLTPLERERKREKTIEGGMKVVISEGEEGIATRADF